MLEDSSLVHEFLVVVGAVPIDVVLIYISHIIHYYFNGKKYTIINQVRDKGPKHSSKIRKSKTQRMAGILQAPSYKDIYRLFFFLKSYALYKCMIYTWACGRDIHTDTSDVLAAALPDLSCRRSSINASACPQSSRTKRHTKTHQTQ